MLNNMQCRDCSVCCGFSLVELLVVLVMAGVLSTAGYSLFREQARINHTQQNLLDMQSSGRAALNFLTQSFVHAGFGCSETNSSFIYLENGASAEDPDFVTISYGADHVATVTANSTDTKNVPSVTVSGKSIGDRVCFFPSIRPNKQYRATGSIALNSEVEFVPVGAKVFNIDDVSYFLDGEELKRGDSVGNASVAFDVVNFQVAYSTENPPNWRDDSGNIDRPRAVWLYLILKTKDRVAGVQHSQQFTLPWNNSVTSFAAINAENGFHYQEFQSQVWIRNAN